jgi:NTE family protein
LRQALLASTAIPLVFPSQEISGQKFSDAGYVDPLPGQVLYQDGASRIISIFLADSTIQNRADYPGATIFQIRPSLRIDEGWTSGLDFSQQAIDKLIELGYQDARDNYAQVLRIVQGILLLQEQGSRIKKLADELPNRSRPERGDKREN